MEQEIPLTEGRQSHLGPSLLRLYQVVEREQVVVESIEEFARILKNVPSLHLNVGEEPFLDLEAVRGPVRLTVVISISRDLEQPVPVAAATFPSFS